MLRPSSSFLRTCKPVTSGFLRTCEPPTTLVKNYTRSGRTVFKNLVQSKKVTNLFSGRNLLVSNTVICCVMSGLGDAVLQSFQNSQYLSQQQHQQQHQQQQKHYDKKRTLHLSLTGFTVGPCCHFWYQILDKYLPGRTLSVIVKKVVVDQILFSPICLSLFFLTLGVLDSSSFREIGREIYHKGIVIYTAEWFIWPPAQAANFYLVPLKFRVLFDNLVSFGFDIFQSHVRYSDLPPEDDVISL